MKSSNIVSVFFLFSALAACNTTGTPSNSVKSVDLVESDFGYPSPPTCEGGESLSFQPVGFDGINQSDVALTGEWTFIEQDAENDHTGYRLDFCLDGQTDSVTLVQMLRRVPHMSPFSFEHLEMKPDSVAPSATWESALGNGGDADLEVIFVNQHDATKSVLLKGWQSASGVPFVTISTYDSASGDKYAVTGSSVYFGKLTEGDPWITRFKQNDRLIEVPELRIELRYKVKEGQNNYKTYRVESVKVIDHNPGLASPFEGEVADVNEPQQFEVVYTHHSLTDQFRIKFPHAVYEVGLGLKALYAPSTGLEPKTFDVACGEVSGCGDPF